MLYEIDLFKLVFTVFIKVKIGRWSDRSVNKIYESVNCFFSDDIINYSSGMVGYAYK